MTLLQEPAHEAPDKTSNTQNPGSAPFKTPRSKVLPLVVNLKDCIRSLNKFDYKQVPNLATLQDSPATAAGARKRGTVGGFKLAFKQGTPLSTCR